MGDKLQLAFGIAGNVTSVLLYAAPIFTFKRVIRKRSTEDFSCVPYVVTLFSSLLYFWYGLPVVSCKWENITVVTICGLGVLFESSFILIYLLFAPARTKKMVILMVMAVIVVVSITALVSTFALHDHHHQELFVGSIGLVVATGMYGSPLVVVVSTLCPPSFGSQRDLSHFPILEASGTDKECGIHAILLILILISQLFAWGPYGLLGRDPFIAIPNLLGCPLGLFQLVLYCIYRKREIHEEPNDKDLENNSCKTEFLQIVINK